MIFEARGGDGPGMFRRPPQDREAEHALLGACLLDNDQIDEAGPLVVPDDFYDPRCADAFRAVLALREQSLPVDTVLLGNELARRGTKWLDSDNPLAGEFAAFSEACITAVGLPSYATHYAAIVRDKAAKRRLILAAEDVLKSAYEDAEPAAALADRAERSICEASDVGRAPGTVSMHQAIEDALNRLDRRRAGEFTGVTTGFLGLDDLLDGLHDGGMYIVAARPSIGKSAFALNVAEHVVAEHGKPVLYVSLEMRRADLAERYLASRGRIDGRILRTGAGLTDTDFRTIADLYGEAAGFHFEIDDHPSRDLSQIAAEARRMKARVGLGLLVLDYVGLIDMQSERGESRQEATSRLSRRIKVLAGDLNVPILALSQLNRQPEGRADKVPQLADLRETGAWEQDADGVILLHRPEFYDPDNRPGEADVMLVKHRAGPTGTTHVRYEGCYVRFSDDDRTPRYDDYGNDL